MARETIALNKERMTLKKMKAMMNAYSRHPVVNLDTWRKGRTAIESLKSTNKEIK